MFESKLQEMVLETYRTARAEGKSAKAAHTAAMKRAADLLGHVDGSWAEATKAQDTFEVVARVTWTTERNGVPKRHAKEMFAADVGAFLNKLAKKSDVYHVDTRWQAA